jgi:hypothetical protein
MRYPFRRPAPDPALEIELTEESFDRWLRAQRPPFEWFLGQPEDVQEALAARGDRYVEDCNVALGYAALDPTRARLGLALEDGDDDAEAELAVLNARTLAEAMGAQTAQNSPQARQPSAPSSFVGVSKRREEAQEARETAKDEAGLAPRLFGRKPSRGVGS